MIPSIRRPLVMLLAALGIPTVALAQVASAPAAAQDPIAQLVARLDLEQYKATIKGLTQFGDRREGTDRNRAAVNWRRRASCAGLLSRPAAHWRSRRGPSRSGHLIPWLPPRRRVSHRAAPPAPPPRRCRRQRHSCRRRARTDRPASRE